MTSIPESRAAPQRQATDAPTGRAGYFWPLTGLAIVLGAVIRLTYVLTDHRALVGGDGLDYHLSAHRLGDGLGYNMVVNGVSAPIAHHPPGWVTVLGVVTWFGGRSQMAHQMVGIVIGLGVIAFAALIGRRYFDPRVGVIAASIAAVYPGFWVLEGNILSEPLGLLLLGFLTLMVFELRAKPTLLRSAAVGAMAGLLTLVRSEELALLVIVVAPTLIGARTLTWGGRVARIGAATLACVLVILPWTIYNSTRFEDPVFLSTNGGGTLLAGNCPPVTYAGKYMGFHESTCIFQADQDHPGLDRSQMDPIDRSLAFENMNDNANRLPATILARLGRTLAVFRPAQTVGFIAEWMNTDTRPIWAWVISFWALIPLALIGVISARRSRAFLLPLLGPLLIVFVTVVLSYGEPRYHSSADLGVVVLAALGAVRLLAYLRRITMTSRPEPKRAAKLPSVYVR